MANLIVFKKTIVYTSLRPLSPNMPKRMPDLGVAQRAIRENRGMPWLRTPAKRRPAKRTPARAAPTRPPPEDTSLPENLVPPPYPPPLFNEYPGSKGYPSIRVDGRGKRWYKYTDLSDLVPDNYTHQKENQYQYQKEDAYQFPMTDISNQENSYQIQNFTQDKKDTIKNTMLRGYVRPTRPEQVIQPENPMAPVKTWSTMEDLLQERERLDEMKKDLAAREMRYFSKYLD